MLANFRPMLGAKAKAEDLRFPLLASPKLDGIRAIWWEGQFYSRTLKPIPNQAVTIAMQELEEAAGGMYGARLNGLDGELIAGSPVDRHCFNTTTSAVMTRNASADDLCFHVFDRINDERPYHLRFRSLPFGLEASLICVVPHIVCDNLKMCLEFEEFAVSAGYEGIILRCLDAPYKQGRSTVSEQGLLKLKRFEDDEAIVVGFDEHMHNANVAKTDERGYTKRSSHKANKKPTGMLGSLVVKWNGKQFNIGTGFTQYDRIHIWNLRSTYLGKMVKFKYLPVGVLEAPRHPVFIGWRED
jgi:DNA ligase 1